MGNSKKTMKMSASGKAPNRKKKKGSSTWIGTAIVAGVLAVMILSLSLMALSSHGTFSRMRKIMKTEHFEITVPMMSYLVYNEYEALVERYQQYSEQLNGYDLPIPGGSDNCELDTSLPLRDQVHTRQTDENGNTTEMTWFDYFANAAASKAEQMLVMCEEAYYYGVSLEKADIDMIEAELTSLEAYAEMLQYKNVSGYIAARYGDGVQLKDVRAMMEISQLSSKFAAMRLKEFQQGIKADRVENYYNEHRDEYDLYMDFIGYTFTATFTPTTVTDNEDTAVDEKLVENEKLNDAYKAEQAKYLERINALAAATSEAEFKGLLRGYLYEDEMAKEIKSLMADKEYTSESQITATERQELSASVEKTVESTMRAQATQANYKKGTDAASEKETWLFATKTEDGKTVYIREVKDTKKIETKADVATTGDSAYSKVSSTYEVYFVTKTLHRNEGKKVGHILFKNDNYKDLTDTSKLSGVAKVLADEVLEANGKVTSKGMADRLLEILMEEGYLTETKNAKGETVYTIDTEVFEEFGSYYNEDVNVTYDDVTLGQMVIEFESWLFDESRVANEITYPAAVETDYGQHIMFYYGDSWYCDIADKLANDDYTAFCEGLIEKYGPVEPDMKDWKYISG